MIPDQWQKAKELFDAALQRPPDERLRFVDDNCNGDEAVRREVESLLANAEEAAGFLEQPAVGEVAEAIVRSGEKLRVSQTLTHYKIIKLLGAGGMGEVYLALDKQLDRKVAIKILDEKFAKHESNLQRFVREAKAASALNHPNILVIYEIGESEDTHFIVSEFIEGKTLREQFGNSATNLGEVLDTSIQIANALTAAHAAHIVHRDIKPENIMLRPDGIVKILDFGLAKLIEQKPAIGFEDSTVKQTQTAKGLIIGTINYMSPEQAKGEKVDERTDIFSFGVLLYELIAGKTPFEGDSMSETLANLINQEPQPLSRFSSNVPNELQRIVSKMLRKNKDERYQTMKGLLTDLKDLKENLTFEEKQERSTAPENGNFTEVLQATTSDANLPTAETQHSFSQAIKPHKPLAAFALVSLLVVLAGAVAIWKIISQSRNQPTTNRLASLRIKQLISWDGEAGEGDAGARFSPNGTMIAYSLTKNGQTNIWTKQIPDGKANPITDGKWNYFNPIWSPDGQRIAFVSNRDNQTAIWAMPFSGGELTPVKAMESNARLLHWSKNGATIYYISGSNLFALDIVSKQINRLTNFDSANQAQYFSVSPGEDRFAYSAGPNERLQIFVMPIGGGQPLQVTNDEASNEFPFWLPDGNRIIYSSERDGIFQTSIAYLDERRTEQINLGISDTLITDVASDGGRILLYQSREESDLSQSRIDDKSETQITSDSGLELWSDVAPDGKSVVFQATAEAKHLLEGSILIRSTDDNLQINIAANGFSPTFSPDGRRVAFLRDANNLINLWIVGKNGADARQLTTEDIWFSGFSILPYNLVQVKDYSWSPDGSRLIYCARKDRNIWQVAADGASAPQQITTNMDANIKFSSPLFAPDGKRIAYISSAVKPSADAKTMTNLYLLNGENSEIVFSSEVVFKLIGWGQNGNNLLIAMPEDELTAKPLKVKLVLVSAGNNRTDLASIEAAYYHNIQLSPNGRKIAFATREDGKDNIRIISMAGSENVKITTIADPNIYVSGIAWSPDGKAIYYSKQKKTGLISMIENFK